MAQFLTEIFPVLLALYANIVKPKIMNKLPNETFAINVN